MVFKQFLSVSSVNIYLLQGSRVNNFISGSIDRLYYNVITGYQITKWILAVGWCAQVKDFVDEIILDNLGEHTVITGILIKEGEKQKNQRRSGH